MKKYFYMFAALVAMVLTTSVFTSCQQDDGYTGDFQENIWYDRGFAICDGLSLEDMTTISNAFREELSSVGWEASSTQNYRAHGSLKGNDARIATACKKAEAKLADKQFKGTYKYHITRVSTNYSSTAEVYVFQSK